MESFHTSWTSVPLYTMVQAVMFTVTVFMSLVRFLSIRTRLTSLPTARMPATLNLPEMLGSRSSLSASVADVAPNVLLGLSFPSALSNISLSWLEPVGRGRQNHLRNAVATWTKDRACLERWPGTNAGSIAVQRFRSKQMVGLSSSPFHPP